MRWLACIRDDESEAGKCRIQSDRAWFDHVGLPNYKSYDLVFTIACKVWPHIDVISRGIQSAKLRQLAWTRKSGFVCEVGHLGERTCKSTPELCKSYSYCTKGKRNR